MVAAGSGSRLDAGRPKAFVDLSGRTLLEHAVARVWDSGAVEEVVVVVPASHVGSAPPGVTAVVGGSSRQVSVRQGLAALSAAVDVVLVHDAARCLAPPSLVAAVAAAVRGGHAAVVPGTPVTDTIRSLDGGVLDRSRLRAVQTPQGFAREVLERAHAVAAGQQESATDDAGLVERTGVPVHVVPGSPEAFKVTHRLDLLLAAAVLSAQGAR